MICELILALGASISQDSTAIVTSFFTIGPIVNFLFISLYLPKPSTVGCDTRSIFKWSTVGLNLVFLLDWLPNQS